MLFVSTVLNSEKHDKDDELRTFTFWQKRNLTKMNYHMHNEDRWRITREWENRAVTILDIIFKVSFEHLRDSIGVP